MRYPNLKSMDFISIETPYTPVDTLAGMIYVTLDRGRYIYAFKETPLGDPDSFYELGIDHLIRDLQTIRLIAQDLPSEDEIEDWNNRELELARRINKVGLPDEYDGSPEWAARYHFDLLLRKEQAKRTKQYGYYMF